MKSFTNSRKLLIIASFVVGVTVAVLIINKIQTSPQKLPATTQQPIAPPSLLVEPPPSPPLENLDPDLVPDLGRAPVDAFEQELVAREEYPKQVMIGLKSWSDIESAKEIITNTGGEVFQVYNWPDRNVIIARLPDRDTEKAILKNTFWGKVVGGIGLTSFGNDLSGGIDYVEEDAEMQLHGQLPDWGLMKIQAFEAWDASNRGRGVKVGIIDTGIQLDHPDLTANIKGGCSFIIGASGCEIGKWGFDNHGHGTKVAGVIAAVDNNIGIVGVAPEAEIYVLKSIEPGVSTLSSQTIAALYWAADNGMDVVNISIGADLRNFPGTRALEDEAVKYAVDRGVVVIASAGNYGSTPGGNYISWPAASSHAIAVGAIGENNERAYFSSYGSEVELVAPGLSNLVTTIGSDYDLVTGGSSISAPYVAGVVALIKSQDPELSPAQVREKLSSTARDLGDPGRDIYYGYGLVNGVDSIITRLPVNLTLTSPTKGNLLYGGLQYGVAWTDDSYSVGTAVKTVDIGLVHEKRGGEEEIISLAVDAINIGQAAVSIPTGLPSSNRNDRYFIQISCGKGYLGECNSTRSGELLVRDAPPQALTITYPNGGEQWPLGTIQSIRWDANYFGGSGIDITILEKKQIPTYSFIPGSQTRVCISWDYCVSGNRWNLVNFVGFARGSWIPQTLSEPPTVPSDDTCHGIIGGAGSYFDCSNAKVGFSPNDPFLADGTKLPNNLVDGNGDGIFELSCRDIVEEGSGYWESRVTCLFKPNTEKTIEVFEAVETLAENTANTGEAIIKTPNPITGDNYFIKASCATNFTGACASGLSPGPFSIVQLTDPVTLTINKSIGGEVNDGNQICDTSRDICEFKYERGEVVNLTARALDTTFTFAGWADNESCSGTEGCQITLNSDQSVSAIFSRRSVSLTATPDFDSSSIFIRWSGQCLEDGSCFTSYSPECELGVECMITVSDDEQVTAEFIFPDSPVLVIEIYELYGKVYTEGGINYQRNPKGYIAGSFNNFICEQSRTSAPTSCTQQYSFSGTDVETLTGFNTLTHDFVGFSGHCPDSPGPCQLLMDGSKYVYAYYTKRDTKTAALTVQKTGAGTGIVVGSGINCGSICSAFYNLHAPVILKAVPDPGSTFKHSWSGACAGTSSKSDCALTMDGDKTVIANFEKYESPLITPGKIKEVAP